MNTAAEVPMIPVPELLAVLTAMGGSDLHLMAGSPPFTRINGELTRLDQYPTLPPQAVREMVYAILPQKLRERFEEQLELDTSYSMPGTARFRVNVYQQRDSVGATFRLIPSVIKSVGELGLPPVVAELGPRPLPRR
jgi:twitching motility protein PilT